MLDAGTGQRETPEYRSAALWLVFLAIPAILTAILPATWTERLLAWAAIAVFAVVFVLAFRRPRLFARWPLGVNLAIWVALLVGAILPAVPAIGWNVAAVTPFVLSVIAFHMSLIPGLVLGIGVAVAVLGSAIFSATLHLGNSWGLGIGVATGTTFVLVMRLDAEHEARNEAIRTELARVRERADFARDVHDILGHSLTVISVKTDLARRLVRSDPDAAVRELDDVHELARSALADVRGTVTELRTTDFATQLEGSRRALEAAGLAVSADGDPDAPPEGALFVAALRELTTNVVRHANAASVRIGWDPRTLTVTDDGDGVGSTAPGNGLTGLRERADAVGATVCVGPAHPGALRPGTTVAVSVP
ncbi:sensor histidine kinase [Microbacterium gorillae]|uniref:sensor histidine kinase n=1 Tax=Microbacterium gorillae TaxID=1231063 RepID=UPI000694F5C6|nr:sensor histidine kinase [Microbacterium gorillae]